MQKLVSAIIPTYNNRRYVIGAVESVLAQTYQPIEIIVVDDGSTDGTAETLAPLQQHIRYLYQENRGVAAARNTGVRAAKGEYVALLDADDLWASTKIAKQVALLEQCPRVGLVFTGVRRVHVGSGRVQVRRCRTGARGDLRRRLLRGNCVPNSSVLIRSACFDTVGLFDESLRLGEDWDMWIRISRRFHFDHVPEPLLTYRIHDTNASKKIDVMHRGQMRVIRRAFDEDAVIGRDHLLRCHSLAYIHADAGCEYLQASEYRAALRHWLHAVALWPFDLRYYRYVARSILKRPVPTC